jgi:hypothetical protein
VSGNEVLRKTFEPKTKMGKLQYTDLQNIGWKLQWKKPALEKT